MPLPAPERTRLEANARRCRHDAIRMIRLAGSGNPGSCLSAADIIVFVYEHLMAIAETPLTETERDRCCLSKGHAGADLLRPSPAPRPALPRGDQRLPRLREPLADPPRPAHAGGGLPGRQPRYGSVGRGRHGDELPAPGQAAPDLRAARRRGEPGGARSGRPRSWPPSRSSTSCCSSWTPTASRATPPSRTPSAWSRSPTSGAASAGRSRRPMGTTSTRSPTPSPISRGETVAGRASSSPARSRARGVSFMEGTNAWHTGAHLTDELEAQALRELGEGAA